MTKSALAATEQWRTLIDNVGMVETTLQALAAGELSGGHESVQEASALLRDVRQTLYRQEAPTEREAFCRTFFEESPIALEQEDWSDAKAEIDRLREQGVTDFRSYFEEHREVAVDIVRSATLVDANQMALRLRGLQNKSDVVGRVVDSPGASLESLIANLVDFAEGARLMEFDWTVRIATGEDRHIIISLSIPSDYEDTWKQVLVCMLDVTERDRVEQALRERETQYRTLFEAIPTGVGLAGYDGRILTCNEAMSRLLGWSQAEPDGLNLASIYHDPEERSVLLERLRTEGRVHGFEATLKRMDGKPWRASFEVIPFVSDGDDVLLMVATDITERKRVEEELQRHREHLEDLVEERTAELARANEQLRQEIVERKLVEDSLRQSEVRSRGLLDAMPDLMFRVAGDGTYLDFKSAPGHVLAHPPDEFLGKRILELEPRVEAERTMSHIQQALQTGETQLFEYEQVLGDITRHYEARIAVSGADEVVAIARDITERNRTEEALRESEKLLRSVLDTNPNAVFVVDRDGRYLLVNRAFVEMLRRTPEEIVGMTALDTIDGSQVKREEAKQFMAEDAAVIDSGEELFVPEQAVRQPDGSVKWYQTIKVPLTMRGESKYVLCVLTDITKRMWAEERVIRSAKLASMGVLAGGIAHEMRNPLGVILACCQLMLESPDDADLRQQALEKTQSAVRRASRVIKDLLRFARPAPAQMADVDVNVVVDETLDLLADHLTLHKVTVGRKSDSGMPEIKGSSQLLQQVFANLALNACTAMPNGGLLTVISRADEAGGVRVDFRDTGVGIPPEHLEHIFEPFFTTMPTGSGLGLSVSYGIIQQHDGDIKVESIVGEGSTFTVCLPTDADGSQSVSADSATEG